MKLEPKHKALGIFGAGIALAAIVSGCGGATSTSNAASSSTTSRPGNAGGGGPGPFPGAAGQIAAINGSTMEVQSQQSGQVTVSWTPSTAFTKTSTVAASSLAPNDCVIANGTSSTGRLTATTVTISQPTTSGVCPNGAAAVGRGFGGGSGGFPNQSSGSRPAGGGNFGFASGKVRSVSATSLVIDGTESTGFPRGSGSSTSSTSAPRTSVTIELTASTNYSEVQPATSSALAVNDCVVATGPADSTGAVTATSVRISAMGPQGCGSGFRPGGGGTANG